MRSGLACLLVFSLAVLPALECPATSFILPFRNALPQDKTPGPPLDDDALPPGAIRELACPKFRHEGAVTSIAATRDGKQILTAGNFSGAFLWDAATGKKLQSFPDETMSLALAPAGDLLALGSPTGAITIYDLPTGKKRIVISNPGQKTHAFALALAPDGKTLAKVAGGEDSKTIRLWNTASGQAAGTLQGHTLAVYGVAYHPDGKSLFSFSEDNTVRQWNLATGKETARWNESPSWETYRITLSADGKSLALVSYHGDPKTRMVDMVRLRVFDTATMTERFGLFQRGLNWHWEIALSADGRYVAASYYGQPATNLFIGQPVNNTPSRLLAWDTWTCKEAVCDRANYDMANCVTFLGTGKRLASAGGNGVVRLWNAVDGTQSALTNGPAGPVRVLAFSPSGGVLAAAEGATVQLLDTAKGGHDSTP